MAQDLIDVFESLKGNGLLFKQDPYKSTCTAVTYLNLAVYLGARPQYTPDEVLDMLNEESQKTENSSWEKNVFPKLADGKVLETTTFSAYNEWINELIRLVNKEHIPVAISLMVSKDNYHEVIVLKVLGNKNDTLVACFPEGIFEDLKTNENGVISYSSGTQWEHHPDFHIYYPKL